MWHCVGLCLHVVCMFFDGHLHQMLGDVRWPVTPAIQHPFYWNHCRARGAHCPTNCWGCWSFVPWPPRFFAAWCRFFHMPLPCLCGPAIVRASLTLCLLSLINVFVFGVLVFLLHSPYRAGSPLSTPIHWVYHFHFARSVFVGGIVSRVCHSFFISFSLWFAWACLGCFPCVGLSFNLYLKYDFDRP